MFFLSFKVPFTDYYLTYSGQCTLVRPTNEVCKKGSLFEEPLALRFADALREKKMYNMTVSSDLFDGVSRLETICHAHGVSLILHYALRESTMRQYFGEPKCAVQVSQTLPSPVDESNVTVEVTRIPRWFEFWVQKETNIVYTARSIAAKDLPATFDKIQAVLNDCFNKKTLPTKTSF